MNELLEARLDLIYPDFRSPLKGDSRVTSICETGDGWFPLLASLFEQFAALAEPSKVQFHARQIKEKFGALRVYFDCTSPGDDQEVTEIAQLLANVAEYLSGQHCEICGAAAQRSRHGGWVRTVCELHSGANTYPTDEYLIKQLLEAPRVSLDLSFLPPLARIHTTELDESRRYCLTLVRYRSMKSYVGARRCDIEDCEHINWFQRIVDAREVAEKLGCYWIESYS